MTLVQSYRTTIEVMHLANEIIKKLNNDKIVLAKPVIRHGEKPTIIKFKKEKDLISDLVVKVKEMKHKGYKSIAIICKTLQECSALKKILQDHHQLDVSLLEGKEESYSAGIMLVPSHIAKGLEFDVVFIVNISETYQMEELDIKLLYVAMTRTLHRLFIYTKEGAIPLLEDISPDLYEE